MYCNARRKQSEYSGRPEPGTENEKKKKPLVPGVPFSISSSTNALNEELIAFGNYKSKQLAVESFNKWLKNKVNYEMQN
jgi:hypothetical protein